MRLRSASADNRRETHSIHRPRPCFSSSPRDTKLSCRSLGKKKGNAAQKKRVSNRARLFAISSLFSGSSLTPPGNLIVVRYRTDRINLTSLLEVEQTGKHSVERGASFIHPAPASETRRSSCPPRCSGDTVLLTPSRVKLIASTSDLQDFKARFPRLRQESVRFQRQKESRETDRLWLFRALAPISGLKLPLAVFNSPPKANLLPLKLPPPLPNLAD